MNKISESIWPDDYIIIEQSYLHHSGYPAYYDDDFQKHERKRISYYEIIDLDEDLQTFFDKL